MRELRTTPSPFTSSIAFKKLSLRWMLPLIECNGIQTHNHLVRKQRLSHLPKRKNI